jgi:hypothetical protein
MVSVIRGSTRAVAITFGVLLVATVVPGLKLQGEPRVLRRGGGVTLVEVDEGFVPQGDRLGANDGDLLLSNGQFQVIVGARSTGRDRLEYGAVLDLTGPHYEDDALQSMRGVLGIAGRPVALITDRVEPMRGRAAPAIRISSHDATGSVSLVTEVHFGGRRGTVELSTRATNRTKSPLPIRLGDVVAWPGVPTFAPGYGEVEGVGRKALSWIGRRGLLAYGLVFPDGPSEVEFQDRLSETEQTCWAAATVLAAGDTATYRRALVATRRGLSEVARAAAALTGQPIGQVAGVLSPAPAWGLLTAIASDGTIAMKENTREDGTFELSLPPARYMLVLQTPGGWDETPVDVKGTGKPSRVSLVVPQAERLDFRITDPDGNPIPGRIVLTGLAGTPDPRFTSLPRVSAAQNEMHSVSGEGRVDIPPGRYRVVVSRGIEWSVAEKVIEVKPEQGVALRVALTHELTTPGWISADTHLHARPSRDSELPLDDRVASLVTAGVEFAVATDHNHVTDYAPAIENLEATRFLAAARGVEVTTRTWGHFNAYPLPAGSPPPPFAVDPPEIFGTIRRTAPEAVIQVNHPWDPGYGYFRRSVLNERTGSHWRKQFSFDFDLIEVVNGYELGKSDVPGKNLRRYFDLLNLGRRYTAVGSSDSHKLTNEWAGYPRTYVRVADDRPGRATAAEIASSLRAGHAVVSLGPFIEAHIGEAGPGDSVDVAPGTVPFDVTVRAADWVDATRLDLVVGGDIVDSFELAPPEARESLRWARTLDVPVTFDTFIAVVVHGERPLDEVMPGRHAIPFAFTNPIWVNVGKPFAAGVPSSPLGRAARGAAPTVELGAPMEPAEAERIEEVDRIEERIQEGPRPPDAGSFDASSRGPPSAFPEGGATPP